MQINRLIEAVLVKRKFLSEQRPFHPHITLGRLHPMKKNIFLTLSKNEIREDLLVKNIVLYESTLNNTGPHYSMLWKVYLSFS